MRPFSSSARTALSHVASCTRLLPQTKALVARRTFTSLPTLRPTLLARANTVFRSHNISPSPSLVPTSTLPAGAEALDIVPKSAITSHPAFGGLQIRCGPRPTMATTSRLVRKRRHGFLSRIRTRTGRRLLQRRKTKGRHIMSN